jgi:hypothetical protein
LLDEIAEVNGGGDSDALMRLYAEDALLCAAAEPDVVVRRDESFQPREGLLPTRLIGAVERIPIDESAGLLRATARIAAGGGRFLPAAERVWLLTFKNRLVHRQRVLESREEAIELYERHGIELGMERPG